MKFLSSQVLNMFNLSSNEKLHDPTQRGIGSLHVINDTDVLFGRGNRALNHKGNKAFRDIISNHREMYSKSSPVRKTQISEEIFDKIKAKAGSFLRETDIDNWIEVTRKDALKKISQALREKIGLNHSSHDRSITHEQSNKYESILMNKSSIHRKPVKILEPNIAPKDSDVIYGRGNHLKNHQGNQRYRVLVNERKHQYVFTDKKYSLSEEVYNMIINQNPPGRFLQLNTDGQDVVMNNKNIVIRKISQCFRENQRLVKREIQPRCTMRAVLGGISGSFSSKDSQPSALIEEVDHNPASVMLPDGLVFYPTEVHSSERNHVNGMKTTKTFPDSSFQNKQKVKREVSVSFPDICSAMFQEKTSNESAGLDRDPSKLSIDDGSIKTWDISEISSEMSPESKSDQHQDSLTNSVSLQCPVEVDIGCRLEREVSLLHEANYPEASFKRCGVKKRKMQYISSVLSHGQ